MSFPIVFLYFNPSFMIIFILIIYTIAVIRIIIGFKTMHEGGIAAKSLIKIHSSNHFDKEHHCILIAHATKSNSDGNFPTSHYFDGFDILINFFNSSSPPIPFEIREITKKKMRLRQSIIHMHNFQRYLVMVRKIM